MTKIEWWKNHATELRVLVSDQKTEIEGLKESLKNLTSVRDKLHGDLSEKSSNIHYLKSKIDALVATRDAQTEELISRNDKIHDLAQANQRLRKALEHINWIAEEFK